MTAHSVGFRDLGVLPMEESWARMRAFTEARDANTLDEIWLLQHPPVYTLGLAGDRSHLLDPGDIPVVPIDRGGQVTYHGPGQLVIYPLLDLRRLRLGVRDLVCALERAVIAYLAELGIEGKGRRDAPGVYVDGAKVASLGLRIRRGCSYHGMAFNIAMDLRPFDGINPCGMSDMRVTQLSALGGPDSVAAVAEALRPHLVRTLGHDGWTELE